MGKNNPLEYVGVKTDAHSRALAAPAVGSFREFLEQHARVPVGKGQYGPYTFAGREALLEIVGLIDTVLGSHTGQPLPDATIALCGGAQFGKTILELNLGAYLTSCAWLNWGFYLPDDNLVQGIVDTKFRPDVIDQIDWFARLTQIGRAVNKSGKAVNRKGAFTVTDGRRRSNGMVIGLNRVPTSFTFDVTTLDEVDDIKPDREKFVRGRMTSSALRLNFKIGTQRIAGRGQHRAFKEGSQGVLIHTCASCGHTQNLEEAFPQCIRLSAIGDRRSKADPCLQLTGDFRHAPDGPAVATHDPAHRYYVACTRCGAELDRSQFQWSHRRPDQIRLRNWSFRISQLGIPAIDLAQIVGEWTRAVVDPAAMATFRCDRLGLPQSTAQKLTAEVLDRSRALAAFDLTARIRAGASGFGGLDLGDRCWFIAREVESPLVKRVIAVEQIAAGNVVARARALFELLGLRALFIDQRPLVNEARTIALALNGLDTLATWPAVPETRDAWLSLPGGLTWDGHKQQWRGLRCAVVRFDKKRVGAGLEHGFDIFEEGGQTKFVPLINCNRFETIDRVVREFLTPAENVVEAVRIGQAMQVRGEPSLRLPRRAPGSPAILETLDNHLIAGSERVKDADGTPGDYVDGCENHLLLAAAYSGLAELVGGLSQPARSGCSTLDLPRPKTRKESVKL